VILRVRALSISPPALIYGSSIHLRKNLCEGKRGFQTAGASESDCVGEDHGREPAERTKAVAAA
jgi:hypothetical protein